MTNSSDLTTWAIVPIKSFSEAKSRLRPVLTDPARSMLATRLLNRTLGILGAARQIDRVLVTSRDGMALAFAEASGALGLAEVDAQGLNFALGQAAAFAVSEGAQRILLIASDLPLLAPADLDLLFADENKVVVAPDRHGTGTNALLLTPPGIIQPAFGIGSFQRHCLQARANGIEPHTVLSTGLGFDLDLPSDYTDLQRIAPQEWGERTFLAGLSV